MTAILTEPDVTAVDDGHLCCACPGGIPCQHVGTHAIIVDCMVGGEDADSLVCDEHAEMIETGRATKCYIHACRAVVVAVVPL